MRPSLASWRDGLESEPMTGRQLEKYELLEEVGQGGMAVVYRGLDTSLQREVAVKILHPHLAKEEESKQRFQREAHAVAKLRHDNILEIYDYSGMESEESFIVTEFIHGQTLKAFLSRNPISHPEVAAMIVVEVGRALTHAHSLGIIHRDIKPENIMIRRDGRVKLMDFGIAQIIDVQKLTVTGQLLGSPAYMAPELVKGRPLDFRSDVFSTGTLLYQLATGEMPFKGRNPHEVLKRIADGQFLTPEIANPLVDGKLGRIIRKALAHDPDDRYQEIKLLEVDLLDFLADVGIEDARSELTAYFADTAGYSRALQARVIEALLKRGRKALQAREKVRALGYFDRLLCADPRNAEVLHYLEHISRQRRLGRALAVLVLVVGLGSGAWAVAAFWPEGTRPGSDGRAPGLDGGSASDLAKRDLRLADARRPRDLRRASDGKTRRFATAKRALRRAHIVHLRPQPVARQIEIQPHPKAVTIFLDNKKLGDYGPDLRTISLSPGAHRLTLRNEACCFDRVIELAADADPKRLRLRLAWKPGQVLVRIVPTSVQANVAVGNQVVRPGQSIAVPIPKTSLDGRTTVDVKVSATGYRAQAQSVKVRANNTTKVTVELQKAKQEKRR